MTICIPPKDTQDYLGGSDGKESVCNAGDLGSILGQEDPLEKRMAPHIKFHEQRSLAGYGCGVRV